MTIVAYTGKAGSGKDYQCNLLIKQGYIKLSFAKILREEVAQIFNIPIDEFMAKYDEFKSTKLFGDTTGRNILEQVAILHRNKDKNYFVREVIKQIQKGKDYCISDLRYTNEYFILYDFCKENSIEFQCIFCDYHSDRYQDKNDNESAWLSNYLSKNGYKDMTVLSYSDIQQAETKLYKGVN